MELLPPSSLPKQSITKSPVPEDTQQKNVTLDSIMPVGRDYDYDLEAVLPHMTSPTLQNFTAESFSISNHNDSTLPISKFLVVDSDSEKSYTVMDLDR